MEMMHSDDVVVTDSVVIETTQYYKRAAKNAALDDCVG
jgi:hypothetical protein